MKRSTPPRLWIVIALATLLAVPAQSQALATHREAGLVQTASHARATAQALPFRQQAKLAAGGTAANDEFGISVAVSGETAVVGAYLHDGAGPDSGAAYVFIRSGATWTLDATLVADDAAAADRFGRSVSISGETIVVGSNLDDDGGRASGSAYVFTRSGTAWTQQAKLVAQDPTSNTQFGFSVAVFGETAVVGAPLDDGAGSDAGSAYVFTRSGTAWTQQAKLVAQDPVQGPAQGANLGWSVAVSDDTVVAGAYADPQGGSLSGAAYVFSRSGATWSQQAKLVASDPARTDKFGYSVAVSGETAIVGSYLDDDGGSDSGSAYVFTRSGTEWSQQAKLVAADDSPGDYFGTSVAISGDMAVVGARFEDQRAANAGAAYVFTRSGTEWTQQAKLFADDAATRDVFGTSVAVSGETVAVGSRFDDDAGTNAGSAYIFSPLVNTDGEAEVSAATVSPARPNPASRRTSLRVTVPTADRVTVTVYDALGRQVALAFDGLVTGSAEVAIDAAGLAPGLYTVRVVGASFAESRRLIVIR